LPSLCLHHLVVQHMILQLVHTLPTLLTITICSISQFKVLLIISRPPLENFLFVAYCVSFLISNQYRQVSFYAVSFCAILL
jgi:hypothetical protein